MLRALSCLLALIKIPYKIGSSKAIIGVVSSIMAKFEINVPEGIACKSFYPQIVPTEYDLQNLFPYKILLVWYVVFFFHLSSSYFDFWVLTADLGLMNSSDCTHLLLWADIIMCSYLLWRSVLQVSDGQRCGGICGHHRPDTEYRRRVFRWTIQQVIYHNLSLKYWRFFCIFNLPVNLKSALNLSVVTKRIISPRGLQHVMVEDADEHSFILETAISTYV